MTYDNKRKQAIGEMWRAIKALKKTLVEIGEDYPVDIRIEFNGSTGEPTVTAKEEWYTVVHDTKTDIYVITADTQAHAEEHANELGGNCSCQSTGETQVTCDCGQA